MGTLHEEAFKREREESGRTGYYSYREMEGLRAAQMSDEILELEAKLRELRRDRRKAAAAYEENGR